MKRGFVEAAVSIAERAHRGQVDKAGIDYITHPERVAAKTRAQGGSPEAVAAAWLHDVIEDADITAAELRDAGIPVPVIEAVEAVTKHSEESLEDYCARVRANPLALRVKLADLEDNTDPHRTALLPIESRQRLNSKYARVRFLLGLPSPE
ncbi:HD domain-containing protein [Micrococcaceae sp. AOP34-BR2-30]